MYVSKEGTHKNAKIADKAGSADQEITEFLKIIHKS